MNESPSDRPSPPRRAGRPVLATLLLAAALVGGAEATQDAVANGDTRTIAIVHQHTKESATVTFKRSGRYDPQALEQLNWLLRDWRHDEPTTMEPRLFDILWETHRAVGSAEPVHVVSAYRSPATNAMLRRRSRGVAKHSQHMQGKAVDFYLPDVPMHRVREVAMRMQNGGVGYYANAYNPFVHLDAGSVRSWPRMTRDQLARLFPDGRTVHLPADNKPMPGYEEAKAEIIARGGSVAGYATYAEADEAPSTGSSRSLWARLFGGSDDEDSEFYAQTEQPRGRQAARPGAPQVAAYAPDSGNSNDAGRYFPALQPGASGRSALAIRRPAPPVEPAPATPADPPPVPAVTPLPAVPTQVASLDPIAPAASPPPMTWQAGAQPAAGALADIPLPPRRPDGLASLAGVLVDAPVPPTRPLALASLSAVQASAGAQLRGALGDLAGAVPPPARTAAAPPAPRPVSPAPQPVRAAEPAAAGDERAALRALFAAAATETTASATVRVATARPTLQTAPNPVVGDSGLALGFAAKPADLPPNRFTGPAVKPLPVRR